MLACSIAENCSILSRSSSSLLFSSLRTERRLRPNHVGDELGVKGHGVLRLNKVLHAIGNRTWGTKRVGTTVWGRETRRLCTHTAYSIAHTAHTAHAASLVALSPRRTLYVLLAPTLDLLRVHAFSTLRYAFPVQVVHAYVAFAACL